MYNGWKEGQKHQSPMPTDFQVQHTIQRLREYRKKYLRKEFAEIDESATRIMVNSFLCDVLGYEELIDIKTEYRIRDTYADYVIQTARKKNIIVEVKAMQLDLNQRHIRQSVEYAVNEGIDWVLLTNGRQVQVYRIIFEKPVRHEMFFSFDLTDLKQINKAGKAIAYLSKKSILKDELNQLWRRQSEISPERLAKIIQQDAFIKVLRREMKKLTKLNYTNEELQEALHKLVIVNIDLEFKPYRKQR